MYIENKKKQKNKLCQVVLRFLLIGALGDLLLADSTLLLYFSESRTRSRISTEVPIF